MCCPMEVRVSCCSCLVHEAGPAPGSSNVRPALATVRVSGPSIKRGGVRDPDGRERPPINPATPASTTSSYPDRGTQDLRPITTGLSCEARWGPSFSPQHNLWLWIPDRARYRSLVRDDS